MSSGLDLSDIYAKLPITLKNLTLDHLKPERNCTAAGTIAAQISYFLDQDIFMTSLPSVSDLLIFLYACSNTTLGKLSPGEAVDWYIYHRESNADAFDGLWWKIVHSNSVCVKSFCRHYNWEGDPDLAGIGVYFTYIIQACMTTLFILLHFYLSLSFKICCQASARFSWFISYAQTAACHQDMLDNFVKIFWTASLYFALAIAIASNLAIKPIMSTYGMTFSPWFLVIGEHFATMVLICLWPWYGRQAKFPNAALLCVALLWLAVYCENGIFYYQPADDNSGYISCYGLKPFWYILWKVSYYSQLSAYLPPRARISSPLLHTLLVPVCCREDKQSVWPAY
ncbi:hypothetical protein B0H65DRAFT_156927 [Neurospora tetraspora]|uniref:Uncharacterized protein n=1 Tax=Neurospora tetraspora TaxID=94610 RepID=A0AAE0JH98_9PEZI|nr:hypothetical protein B0H65DRAFT_156927 [Neurospora tetraspora]